MSESEEKICFIISPIGKEGAPDYIHFKKVRRHFIDKVATEKGYKTIRADDISEPGKITSQIIDQLRKADLVIADLSNSNPNVYYELAIRDAVRLPVILIGDNNVEIPFDVRAQRLLKYSIDLDEIEESRNKLAEYIDAVEREEYRVDSPVTEALITPSDEISSTNRDYLALILRKISSLNEEFTSSRIEFTPKRSILTSSAPTRSLTRDFNEITYLLNALNVSIVVREPNEMPEFKDNPGQSVDRDIFMQFVTSNLSSGVTWVNYDPMNNVFWLWMHKDRSQYYYFKEEGAGIR